MTINLEIGFRFLPPDEQIISFFLKNKMMGDHQTTYCIPEVDLLKHEPWQLPDMSVVRSTYPEWLFFYKLNKISQRKNDRSTNDGFWKSTGTDRPIGNGDKPIGYKKTLVFYKGRTPHGIKTDWVMHEFRAHPDFVPPNADNTYVVGYLRNNAVEKTENSISNVGQPSTPCAASSLPNNELRVASMEVALQTQSDMDYVMALQMQMHMQMEDEGIFDYDLSPSSGLHNITSIVGLINNDQSRIEEEGISLEDLGFAQTDDLVDEEKNEWHFPDDTIEEEIEFMDSLFHNQDEYSNVEAECMRRSDTDPNRDNDWSAQMAHLSDGTGGGYSEGLHQKRMETGFHHDEILLMDSGVESGTVKAYEINCLESVKEERSVNSRVCKSQYEPRSHKSVVQRHPIRVQLQSKSLGKAVTRNKTRESGVRGPVTQPVRNNKSILQANKGPKMDGGRNTELVSSSRSKGSAGSSRKNSFNVVGMSQQSCDCKPNPPLIYVVNVIVGLILFIVVVREMFIQVV